MEKSNPQVKEWYMAQALSVDRRTYLMCLRYLSQNYNGEHINKATMLLIGNRSQKHQNKGAWSSNKSITTRNQFNEPAPRHLDLKEKIIPRKVEKVPKEQQGTIFSGPIGQNKFD